MPETFEIRPDDGDSFDDAVPWHQHPRPVRWFLRLFWWRR